MKKNLKIFFIIILLFTLVIPITYSYAMSIMQPDKNEKQFFEILKTEVTKKEKVEMIINLDEIDYNEFVFELNSDEVIENLEVSQDENILTQKNNNEIVMQINKSKTNVNSINLFYSIPESKNVGDTIKFVATITKIINSEEENENNIIIDKEKEEIVQEEMTTSIDKTDNFEKENEAETNELKQETQSIELEIKIIEEKNEEKQEDNKPETQMPDEEKNKQDIMSTQNPSKNSEFSNIGQKNPSNNSNFQYNSMSNMSLGNSQVVKVTYNGSDNNYLSSLAVNGYEFNREFSKENTTYFITIGNEIEKLDITASAQDDEATVCVYGNEELKEGTNKILIAVTAENGNVRNYRIYVTKNS